MKKKNQEDAIFSFDFRRILLYSRRLKNIPPKMVSPATAALSFLADRRVPRHADGQF